MAGTTYPFSAHHQVWLPSQVLTSGVPIKAKIPILGSAGGRFYFKASVNVTIDYYLLRPDESSRYTALGHTQSSAVANTELVDKVQFDGESWLEIELTPAANGTITYADIALGASDAEAQLAAGEAHVGEVGEGGKVFNVTLTLDTVVYAAGDVLSDTATLANAVRANGRRARLKSIVVIDEDDQGIAFDIFFFSLTQSLGAKNAVPDITDIAARDLLGAVSIVAGDYIDLGGVRVATKAQLDLVLEAAAASRDLFLGTITRGAPTYTANGLKLRLGLTWD